MADLKNIYFVIIWLFTIIKACRCENTSRSFPANFEFGASTAAHQIEGAWNEDGKGWSMWDYKVRTDPKSILDETNGDVAANSYYLYKRDVEMLKELGADNYRFSIAWPRILPYGRANYVNPQGIAYYNNLINELLANGITPFVTIYHWDLPQNLSELGGWLNDDIVEWFGDYARVLFENFGDRVKNWMTINEPYIHCYMGYGMGTHAPGHYSPGKGYYDCGRNVLLAHARAYHIYDEEFRQNQQGQVGLVTSMEWGMPVTDSDEDAEAFKIFAAFHMDYFMHPVYSEQGDYPALAIEKIAEASTRQGLNESRLRTFTQSEVEYVKGTGDFLALNHYSSRMVYKNSSVDGTFPVPSIDDDMNIGVYADPSWPSTGFTVEYGPGLYFLLHYIKDNYYNLPIYITENGCSTSVGLNDHERVQYYRNYLSSVRDAVHDGCNVKGYFAWSLMDNFEWANGYTIRFGLYEVDMENENRTRTQRKSALVYKEIIKSRVIDFNYNPDPYAAADSEEQTNENDNSSSSVTSRVSILSLIGVLFIYFLS